MGDLCENLRFTGEQNGKGNVWNGQAHSREQSTSIFAELHLLQIERNDFSFKKWFRFVHVRMDSCDNPDPTVWAVSELLSPENYGIMSHDFALSSLGRRLGFRAILRI